MLQLYHCITSIGTVALFFTVLWTLHVDIKLINTVSGRVKLNADLILRVNTQSVREIQGRIDIDRGVSPDNTLVTTGCERNHSNQKRAQNDTPDTTGWESQQLPDSSYWSALQMSLEQPEVVNRHDFRFQLHPGNACAENDVFLLVYVHSAPENHKRRMVIRNTWGNQYNIPLLKLKVLFFLGVTDPHANPGFPSSSTTTLQEALRFEHERYRDIVQGNYIDSYRNLTYKAISALKYVTDNCLNVAFVLKTDDDVFVNVFSLARHLMGGGVGRGDHNGAHSSFHRSRTKVLIVSHGNSAARSEQAGISDKWKEASQSQSPAAGYMRNKTITRPWIEVAPSTSHRNPGSSTHTRGQQHTEENLFLACLVWYRMKVVRERDSKWYVPRESWRQDYFPPYCSGAAYLFSGATAQVLYNASLFTPFFWIDDLYITGVLTMRLGIRHHKFTHAYQLDFTKFYNAYEANPENAMQWIFSHIDDFSRVNRLWSLISSRRRYAKLDNWVSVRAQGALPPEYVASFTQT